MIVLKIILIVALLMVFWQDLKVREVHWFLFPIIAIIAATFLYKKVFIELFYTTLVINISFVLLLIIVVYFYSKLKLKTSIKSVFGLGDGLVFIALAFTFSSVSFLILFVFGLIFSLALHLALKRKSEFSTVPLAGYLSLFFAISYLSHWSGLLKSVYTI